MGCSVKTGSFGNGGGGGVISNYEKIGTYDFPIVEENKHSLLIPNIDISENEVFLIIVSIKGNVTAGLNKDTIYSLCTCALGLSVEYPVSGFTTVLVDYYGSKTTDKINTTIKLNPTERTITIENANQYFTKNNYYTVDIFKI